MERLEAAMAKARAARSKAADPAQTRAPGVTPEEAAPSGTGTSTGASTGASMAPNAAAANWLALPEIQIPEGLARRKRLTAFLGAEFSPPFDILRARVVRQMQENRWTRLAVTSPTPQCGKTMVSLNLALSLARFGQLRVLVMDFDLRRPSIAATLDRQTTAPTLIDLLQGRAGFADQAVRFGPNLAICANRTAVRQSAELLQNEATAGLLDRIEDEWQPDIMIFDTPPMRGNDDNLGFLPRVDCALIVAAAGSSTLPQIDRCEQEVGALTNVLGTVLNKCRYPDSTTGYDNSYYYG
jgi:Mrp family chromosome partitioning ATPase